MVTSSAYKVTREREREVAMQEDDDIKVVVTSSAYKVMRERERGKLQCRYASAILRWCSPADYIQSNLI